MIFQGGGFEEEEDDYIVSSTLDRNNINKNNNNSNSSSGNRNILNDSSSGNFLNISSTPNKSNNTSGSLGLAGGNSSNIDFEITDAFDHNQLYLSKGGGNFRQSNFIFRNNNGDELDDDDDILIFENIGTNSGGDGDDDDEINDGDDENENGNGEGGITPFKRNRSLLEVTQGYEFDSELEISVEGGSTISSLHRDEVITEYFEPNVDESPYYNRLKLKQQQQYQQQQAAIQAFQQQQQLQQQQSSSPSNIPLPMDHHYSERKINIPKVRFNPEPTTTTTSTTTTNINNNSAPISDKTKYEQSKDKKEINSNYHKKIQENKNQLQNNNSKKSIIQQQKLLQKQQKILDREESEEDIIEESAGEGDGPEDDNEGSDKGDEDDEDLVYSFDDIKGCNCFTPYINIVTSNKNYTLLWFASLISLMGDWLNEVACLTILGDHKASNTMVSVFLIVRESPPFLFQFLTGVVSDSFDRRYVMFTADIIRMILVLFFLFIRSEGTLWLLYVLAFLQYGTGSFYNPSKSALLPSIVEKHDLVTANALEQSSYSSMMLLGASLGGVISYTFGTRVNFILDSFTYAASAVCIFLLIRNTKNLSKQPINQKVEDDEANMDGNDDGLVNNNNNSNNGNIELSNIQNENIQSNNDNDKVSLIKNDQLNESSDSSNDNERNDIIIEDSEVAGDKKNIVKDFFITYKIGIKYLSENRYVFLIVFSKASGSLIWGIADMINIEIAKTNFQIGDSGSLSLGIILGAGGFGILLVPLLFARIIKDVPSNYNKILKVGFFLNGFCTLCLGLSSDHFPIYLFFNCLRSSSTCIIWMYSSSILQQLLPDQVLGRVFATEYALLTLFNTASKIIVGFVLDYTDFSVKQILVTAGIVGVVIFFIWLNILKTVKRIAK